jgi:pyrroloquinoline quinone biosynthesis protein B
VKLRVLGSAAGGGFPQWNCACANCRAARAGDARVERRTQDSVAASGDGDGWILLNASPDVRAQIEATQALTPQHGRGTPIRAIVLTNGDVDHVLGLFCLRESTPLVVWATEAVEAGLRANALWRTLERFPDHVVVRRLELGGEHEVGAGLVAIARPIAGTVPLHLAGRATPSACDNVGIWLRCGASTAAYVPGARSLDGLAPADVLLFDGTFFESDELVRLGLGTRRAEDMGHVPIAASLALRGGFARRIYTHVNNTNPILRDDSEERARVVAAGWELARDGMELELR